MSFRRTDWIASELSELFTTLEFGRLLARIETTFVSHKDRYRTILSEADLDALVAEVRTAGELALAVLPLAPLPGRTQLLGVGVAAPGIHAAYIPVAHRYLGAPAQLPAATVIAKLAPLLTDAAVAKHIHNFKDALVVLANLGVAIAEEAEEPGQFDNDLNVGQIRDRVV